jgi:hypothetical protein
VWGAHNLAQVLDRSGRPEEALALYEDLLQRRTRLHGADHPETLQTQGALAELRGRMRAGNARR